MPKTSGQFLLAGLMLLAASSSAAVKPAPLAPPSAASKLTDPREGLRHCAPSCLAAAPLSAVLARLSSITGIDARLEDAATDSWVCTDPDPMLYVPANLQVRFYAGATGHRLVWLDQRTARLRRMTLEEHRRRFTHCTDGPRITRTVQWPSAPRPGASPDAE